MSLANKIKELSKELYPEIQKWRRHIHANPELAFNEIETAAFVSSLLTKYNIPHQTGVAKTGVVGLIKGKNADKKCIALRADMDALPIQEANDHSYTSKNKGIMHACGHDFHTASLLGAAVVLNQLKDEFEGTVKLIFQPSEEKMPGGASIMIQEGVLENPKVDAIIAQHASPELPTHIVGFCEGKFMASADEIYLTVKGKGGHAAFPHLVVDTVLISAQILVNLQQVISRKKSPFEPAVLSFGKIEGLGATNIIPSEVNIAGTLRAMNEEFRMEAISWIKKIATETAQSFGGECLVDIELGYPCLVNDSNITQFLFQKAAKFLESNNVKVIAPRMGAEDFAYYSQKVPAFFYRLGTGGSEATKHGLHTPNFDVDEAALETAAGFMTWNAIALLNEF
jgi:amidohydrolase